MHGNYNSSLLLSVQQLILGLYIEYLLVMIWCILVMILSMELMKNVQTFSLNPHSYLVSHVKEYIKRIQRAILNQDITGSLAERWIVLDILLGHL